MARLTQLGFLGLPSRARFAEQPEQSGYPDVVFCFDANVESESKLRINGITSVKKFSGSVATEIAMKGSVSIHE